MDGPTTPSDGRAANRVAAWDSLSERLAMAAIATVLLCTLAAAVDPEPRFMLAMLAIAVVLLAVTGLAALALRWFLIGRHARIERTGPMI